MTKHDDGGPAHPHPALWQGPQPEPPDDLTKGAAVAYRFGSPGLSLHDQYVGQAITGLCAGLHAGCDNPPKWLPLLAHVIAADAIAEKRRREAEK